MAAPLFALERGNARSEPGPELVCGFGEAARACRDSFELLRKLQGVAGEMQAVHTQKGVHCRKRRSLIAIEERLRRRDAHSQEDGLANQARLLVVRGHSRAHRGRL